MIFHSCVCLHSTSTFPGKPIWKLHGRRAFPASSWLQNSGQSRMIHRQHGPPAAGRFCTSKEAGGIFWSLPLMQKLRRMVAPCKCKIDFTPSCEKLFFFKLNRETVHSALAIQLQSTEMVILNPLFVRRSICTLGCRDI